MFLSETEVSNYFTKAKIIRFYSILYLRKFAINKYLSVKLYLIGYGNR